MRAWQVGGGGLRGLLDLVQKPLSISRWQEADFVDQSVQLAHRLDPKRTLCQAGSDGQACVSISARQGKGREPRLACQNATTSMTRFRGAIR